MTASVLHVVESFGGGVSSAIKSYVRSTRDLDVEHHLLATIRTADFEDDGEFAQFRSVASLPRSVIPALSTISARVRELGTTHIHAHSSYAGFYTRLAVKPRSDLSVVYTPHCYAFERDDIPRPARMIFRAVERVLSRRTTTVAACSERELVLAQELNGAIGAVFIPNVSFTRKVPVKRGSLPLVVGIGRLTAQKDPSFFAATIRRLRATGEFESVWIGGGAASYVSELEREGVRVTGWLPHSQASALLASAHLYVHSARWEGFPMAILEAIDLGVPAVAREIASIPSAGSEWVNSSSEALARSGARVLGRSDASRANLEYWRTRLAQNTSSLQAIRLNEVYKAHAHEKNGLSE